MPTQPNCARTFVGLRKPEFTDFGVNLFDLCFLRPKGRILRWDGLNAHNGEILRINPDSPPVKQFVVGARFY